MTLRTGMILGLALITATARAQEDDPEAAVQAFGAELSGAITEYRAAIAEAKAELEQLQTLIQKYESAVRKMEAMKNTLDGKPQPPAVVAPPAPGAYPPAPAPETYAAPFEAGTPVQPYSEPTLQATTRQFIGTAPVSPYEPGLDPSSTATAPAEGRRLDDLERKLDRLIDAVEGLKADVDAIKRER